MKGGSFMMWKKVISMAAGRSYAGDAYRLWKGRKQG